MNCVHSTYALRPYRLKRTAAHANVGSELSAATKPTSNMQHRSPRRPAVSGRPLFRSQVRSAAHAELDRRGKVLNRSASALFLSAAPFRAWVPLLGLPCRPQSTTPVLPSPSPATGMLLIYLQHDTTGPHEGRTASRVLACWWGVVPIYPSIIDHQ